MAGIIQTFDHAIDALSSPSTRRKSLATPQDTSLAAAADGPRDLSSQVSPQTVISASSELPPSHGSPLPPPAAFLSSTQPPPPPTNVLLLLDGSALAFMHSLSFTHDAIQLSCAASSSCIPYASIIAAAPAMSSPLFQRALELQFMSRARASTSVSLLCSDGRCLDFVCVSTGYKHSFVRGLCDALGRVHPTRAVAERIEAVLLQPHEEVHEASSASADDSAVQAWDDGAQEDAATLRVIAASCLNWLFCALSPRAGALHARAAAACSEHAQCRIVSRIPTPPPLRV